ncbi:unnamed protein product, partial [Hapterophycus canaliculatus]
MTEKQLRRFLEVMVDNLVDSNVFMRSLVLSLEHGGSAFRRHNIHGAGGEDDEEGDEEGGEEEPCYLGHTWYDVRPREVPEEGKGESRIATSGGRSAGGFQGGGAAGGGRGGVRGGRGGVTFPEDGGVAEVGGAGEAPRELTRLQRFLKQNTPQLVRDLMCVVNLETINHENICCLNTAVLILIFADQRGQLA